MLLSLPDTPDIVAARFAMADIRHAAPKGDGLTPLEVACDHAAYWESFPASYSQEQVAAAHAFILSWDGHRFDALAALRVALHAGEGER